MPALSVVVPIYNVEDYLQECLESLAVQTFGDLEVVMVNDGSTDGSPAIAEAFAARDPRFKVVHRPNGGLSAARNTGIEHATGEFLAFVDSDDVLLDNAYELLVGTLRKTSSDFSTGKVLRLTATGTKNAKFLRKAFQETRLETHIKRFRPLLADRIAWNKVFRRAFWDAQGLRFPEGRINEDIPVILPLHFSARSVDVIAEPVYLWRIRDTGELSITERRAEVKALQMRLWAVSDVHDYLAEHESRKVKHWYDQTLVDQDLKYHLNVLDRADDEYRAVFMEQVNALLDRADDSIYDPLLAIDRLKWALVRRRMLPELLEVLRFQREELATTPPVRVGRHWYGDYPYRGDARVGLPDSIYRLRHDLTFTARIERLRRDGHELRVGGVAFVDGVGAPTSGYQQVSLAAVGTGRLRRARLLVSRLRFRTTEVHRPDSTADGDDRRCDTSWSGFEATLDLRRLRRAGRWREGTWDVFVTAKAPGVTRRRVRFFLDDLERPRAVELPSPPEVLVRALPTADRELRLEVRTTWAVVRGADASDDVLELRGELHGAGGDDLKLELRGADGATRLRRPLKTDGERFTATIPFARLLGALTVPAGDDEAEPDAEDEEGAEEAAGSDEAAGAAQQEQLSLDGLDARKVPTWELVVIGGGRRLRVALPEDGAEGEWPCAGRALALVRTAQGDASLTLRAPHDTLTHAAWTPDGALELAGRVPAGAGPREIVLASRRTGAAHAFGLEPADDGTFRMRLDPARITSLAGPRPLGEGYWQIATRPAGTTDLDALLPFSPDRALRDQLPLATEAGGKPMRLALTADDRVIVVSRRALALDERGPYHQRRLRTAVYPAARREPLTDTVVYSSFRGRQYSDNPRAIHEELVRREAPLEHLWIVDDAQANVPPTARVLHQGSRETYEALARSRYVVFNDHFPGWFSRREDQMCLQTWHGTPIKRLGFDAPMVRGRARLFGADWERAERNWQHVLSPGRFATPILQQAYRLTGEILETGYPRVDQLIAADREERAMQVRRRLGIPDGVRAVLYAPTFRDDVRDRRRRYRLDLRLDVERLRDALGPDTMLLIRRHHYTIDAVPTAGGFALDVSTYPDASELLLAADVLVTDYSSLMVDYANTGRPMLFYTYDLDAYRDEIRGFYVDYEETVPGPRLRTSDELAEALVDVDAVRAEYADRYDAFVQRFCELDDGGAAGRVVDRLFSEVVAPVRG